MSTNYAQELMETEDFRDRALAIIEFRDNFNLQNDQ